MSLRIRMINITNIDVLRLTTFAFLQLLTCCSSRTTKEDLGHGFFFIVLVLNLFFKIPKVTEWRYASGVRLYVYRWRGDR